MKDIVKINDILSSIKQVRKYQKRVEINLIIDNLLADFLPCNLRRDIKAFSLKDGILTLVLSSSVSKANFIFMQDDVLKYLKKSLPKIQLTKIDTKINPTNMKG